MRKRLEWLWKAIALISLFVILAALLAELFLHLSEEQEQLLLTIELIALLILFLDLAIHFYRAKHKKKFLKENWLMVLSFLPFGSIFRIARGIRFFGTALAGWFSKVFHLVTHSTKFARAYRAFAMWFSKSKEKKPKKR